MKHISVCRGAFRKTQGGRWRAPRTIVSAVFAGRRIRRHRGISTTSRQFYSVCIARGAVKRDRRNAKRRTSGRREVEREREKIVSLVISPSDCFTTVLIIFVTSALEILTKFRRCAIFGIFRKKIPLIRDMAIARAVKISTRGKEPRQGGERKRTTESRRRERGFGDLHIVRSRPFIPATVEREEHLRRKEHLAKWITVMDRARFDRIRLETLMYRARYR